MGGCRDDGFEGELGRGGLGECIDWGGRSLEGWRMEEDWEAAYRRGNVGCDGSNCAGEEDWELQRRRFGEELWIGGHWFEEGSVGGGAHWRRLWIGG